MSVLLLRLAGPLQSWGDASRFSRRETRSEPTKSGVLGLLAAAQGRRRTDSLEDLLGLRFGVRADQPGRLIRDFQTAIRWTPKREPMPLSYRYYLSDAVFVAAVEGDRELISSLDQAVRSPRFAPYLGRRSCPPTLPVALGVVDDHLETALLDAPWEASGWYRRRLPRGRIPLEVFVDAPPAIDSTDRDGTESAVSSEIVRDVPLSWDPRRREYGWRAIMPVGPAEVDNPTGRSARVGRTVASTPPARSDEPDFFLEVGGHPCT